MCSIIPSCFKYSNLLDDKLNATKSIYLIGASVSLHFVAFSLSKFDNYRLNIVLFETYYLISLFLLNIYVEEMINVKYGYVRVSTAQQHIDRHIDALLEMGLDNSSIYIDYESGKDFNRKNYKKLIRKLKKDDLLIIKSIDRLGRDYNMIIEEWRLITKEKEADIMVIDMLLLDIRIEGKNLVGKFI